MALDNKYLLFTTQYPPLIGGVPNFYYRFCGHFPKDKIVVFTAARGNDGQNKNEEYVIYRSHFLKNYKTAYKASFLFKSVCILLLFLWILFKSSITAIIIGQADTTMLFFGYFAKKMFHKRFIVFLHGDGDSPDIKLRSDSIKAHFYKSVDIFVVNSTFTKKRLQSKYFITDTKIITIYPGVDTKIFFPNENQYIKKKLGLANKKILLTVGRLDKRKGHDYVIRSLPQVIAEIPDTIYVIVGDGDERQPLIDLANKLDVQEYVKFVGAVSNADLPQYYNICDLFIMANRILENGDAEGFGMVFIEANACGKPVIGGRSGGAIEAIEDNVGGIILDSNNIKEISDKVITLFKQGEIRERLGSNGLSRVREKFDWQIKLPADIENLEKSLTI